MGRACFHRLAAAGSPAVSSDSPQFSSRGVLRLLPALSTAHGIAGCAVITTLCKGAHQTFMWTHTGARTGTGRTQRACLSGKIVF